MEAMATGKPVVASAVGGIPELVRNGETGLLVSPRDPAALGHGLVYMLEDEAAGARMGRAGRRVVEDGFDQDRTNDTIELLFRELAARP
jgi:glycosyltransferase involved in cell wall biosynthesis